jgi:hypothetical protein
MRSALFLGTCLALLTACSTHRHSNGAASQPSGPEPYMRVHEQGSNLVELQIAVRKFAPARRSEPAVLLAAVSHIGEPDYYAALQKQLDPQTLVLFEGVGHAAEPGETNRGQPPPPPAEVSHRKDLSSLQTTMASSLGLVFQLEAIDYDRTNFRSSDLSIPQIRNLVAQQSVAPGQVSAAQSFESLLQTMQGGSLFDAVLKLGLRYLTVNPRLQALAKIALIDALAQIQGDLAQLQGMPPDIKQLFEVLLQRRNQKVLADLKTEIKTRKPPCSVAVFYGAGHMSDLENQLRTQLGYRPVDQVWLTAFSVDLAKAGVSENERKFMSGMIKRQLEVIQQRK